MTTVSYVSKLQEYCQKHKYNLPIYTSDYISGSSHNPIYKITCKLDNDIIDVEANSIKNGKDMVAKIIYDKITNEKHANEKHTHEINISSDIEQIILDINSKLSIFNTIVFVDYENVNISVNQIQEDIYYILISAKNCTKQNVSHSNVYNAKCNFVGKDVADIFLIYLSGRLNINDKKIFIFTNDHYGDSLARILNGYHICNIGEIEKN